MKTCVDCVFWNGRAEHLMGRFGAERETPPPPWALGDCRRYAPTESRRDNEARALRQEAAWPKTVANDWCGELQPLPEPAPPIPSPTRP